MKAARTISIETAEGELKRLLAQLRLGETITLVDSGGVPEALLVSLKSVPGKPPPPLDWEARWDALAEKPSRAWKSDKSAVETLVEMRR